LDLITNTQTK